MNRVSTPLVSVGLPVFNGERYLAQALDTMLAQTLDDLEVVVSDNASTDRTAQISRDYAARDPRVRYFRQDTNIGAVRNFNFVAQQARGRYFKWASANDYCELNMLEKYAGVLDTQPGVVLCLGRTCMVDEQTGERSVYDGDIPAIDPRPSERFRSVARNLVMNNELWGLMRLEAVRRTRLIPLYKAADLVFTIELSLYGCIMVLPEILNYRRVGSGTHSVDLSPAEMEAFLYASSKGQGNERWRRRIDLFRAVMRAPISASEKARALMQAAHRVGRNPAGKSLKPASGERSVA